MGKRHVRHPEAVAKERAGLAPDSTLPRKGWQPDYGWVVVFYRTDDNKQTRDYPPGTPREVVVQETRLSLKQNWSFTKAWIIQKNGWKGNPHG